MSSNNAGLLISSIPMGRVDVLDLLMIEGRVDFPLRISRTAKRLSANSMDDVFPKDNNILICDNTMPEAEKFSYII